MRLENSRALVSHFVAMLEPQTPERFKNCRVPNTAAVIPIFLLTEIAQIF
jgi:hypothetical protein